MTYRSHGVILPLILCLSGQGAKSQKITSENAELFGMMADDGLTAETFLSSAFVEMWRTSVVSQL